MKNIHDVDKLLIYHLSGDLGDGLTPYADLATKTGLDEEEIIRLVGDFQAEGLIRRFGATLWHQRSGFSANAMVVFAIEPDKAEQVGFKLAARPYVSHCYLRRTTPGWPFNIYAMIHAESREKILDMTKEMASLADTDKWRMLESLKELKKASRRYFSESFEA